MLTCYRCGLKSELIAKESTHICHEYSQPFNLLNKGREICSHCYHPFVRCFLNFNVLPLVEFVPFDGISEEEAKKLLLEKPSKHSPSSINNDDNDEERRDDNLFYDAIDKTLAYQQEQGRYCLVQVDRTILRSLHHDEILICQPISGQLQNNDQCIITKTRYFKNILPDVGIAYSQSCQQFFNESDFEFSFLKEGGCPISRAKDIGNVSTLWDVNTLHYIIC